MLGRPKPPVPFHAFDMPVTNATRHLLLYELIARAAGSLDAMLWRAQRALAEHGGTADRPPFERVTPDYTQVGCSRHHRHVWLTPRLP
jgi:hypothetical protein